MASDREYLDFILEQLSELDEISCKAMMGEYILYYRGKIIGGVYDNRFLVKPVKSARDKMPEAEMERPYEGAKEMLLVDNVENKEFLRELIEDMYEELPAPKKKEKAKAQKKLVSGFIIRPERDTDHREVENLIRESFWNVYRPGCSEHYVIHVLRNDPAFVRELDFVMEQDGRLIGQNMFMKTVIEADDGRAVPVLTMGPICIVPELKRQGYGKALLDYSLERAAELGYGAVLFEGNIGFYGHCGFTYAREFGIRYHDLPEGADDSFFLCRELRPGYLAGVTGVYQTPQGYYVSDADVEEFDKDFPPKQKLKLPGQLF